METQAWLESSLRRSASLGLEVLERASRRSVNWADSGASQTPTTTDEDTEVSVDVPARRTHTELDDVFSTIADFMAQTTYQCKRFYESGRCAEPTDTERIHVSRFHRRSAAGTTTSALSRKPAKTPYKKGRMPAVDEDFFIEVSPGTYAVTATMPDSQQQQTQLVTVKSGESVDLTFNL